MYRMSRWIFFCFFLVVACTNPQKSSNTVKLVKLNQIERLKLASVQFLIEGNKGQAEFFKKVEAYIVEAHQKKVNLIVFPELLTLDLWPKNSKQSEKELIKEIAAFTPQYIEKIKAYAQKYNIDIVAGSMPFIEGKDVFNRAYFVSHQGDVQYHDKIILTPWGKKMGFATGKVVEPIKTDWGTFILLICYDIESPIISAELAKSNLKFPLIVVPSMTESEEGFRRVKHTAQARAIEHHAYVLVSGTVGKVDKDWNNIGQGSILGPQYPGYPDVLKQGKKNQAGLVIEEVNIGKLQRTRAENKFFPAQEPHPF